MRLLKSMNCFIFGTIFLYSILSSVNAIDCPALGEDPTLVDVVDNKQQFKLSYADPDTLCLLVQAKHTDPTNSGPILLNNDSPGSDFTITPIGRSFDGSQWTSVSGAFSRKLKLRRCNNKKTTCTVVLRKGLDSGGSYFLITTTHSKTDDETLSRFLTQTTFGPTRAMISEWSYSKDVPGFAAWVKDQMEMAPTKHREFYRKKADYVSDESKIDISNVVVQHPCSGFSRWRRHAFTEKDFTKNFEVYQASPTQLVVVVDNIVRTVVSEFRARDGTFNGPGYYQFCYMNGAKMGGEVEVMVRNTGQCKRLDGGNPLTNLAVPASYAVYAQSLQFINLPDISSFELMPSTIQPGWGIGPWRYDNESYKLKSAEGITNTAQCNALDTSDFSNVIGVMSSGEYVIFAGYAEMLENSIESPLADGGMQYLQNGAYNCANAPMSYENIDTCFVANDDACEASTHGFYPWRFDPVTKKNVVVCGSDGEVASEKDLDPSEAGSVQPFGTQMQSALFNYPQQVRNVPYTIFLKAQDQLRQRMAWALSQILVITPNQIDTEDEEAEPYLKYYDIFVNNAFGNYRDILKAVAYSPMMAEMLSYLESKSAAFVLKSEGRVSRPDENFAREIMQLFSIGLYQLRLDGSVKRDQDRVPLLTYSNSDIQTFARAWTGFKRETSRFNREGIIYTTNRLDPMAVDGRWRDPFPKMDLNRRYIGDGYPLCIDLPSQHFLRVGATYRLLGSAHRTKMQYETIFADYDTQIERFKLDTNSELYQKLCNMNNQGICEFKPVVTLDENLQCTGKECGIDNLSAVIVQDDPAGPLKYEYVRPACVEHAFYENGSVKKIVSRGKEAMCLHEKIDDVAMDACCLGAGTNDFFSTWADYLCEFSFERSSYGTTQTRCQSQNYPAYPTPDTCDWSEIRLNGSPHPLQACQLSLHPDEVSWHWTNQSCGFKAKVNPEGLVAIVHNPNLDINTGQVVSNAVNENNLNFFKVAWQRDQYPSAANQCSYDACNTVDTGCLCDVEVTYKRVFDKIPSKAKLMKKLKVGSPPPESFDQGTYTLVRTKNGISMYRRQGDEAFSTNTIFELTISGKSRYFKNVVSIVSIPSPAPSQPFAFRNPPHFLNIAKPDTRDATYETDAVLDYYFNHPNTPPFLASRILQRFGISNPSPKQIKRAAKAFIRGTYESHGVEFGEGNYGDLAALIASIILDVESTSVILDADPSTGSLREPLVKLMSFLRAMEYESAPQFPSIIMENLQDNIGQEAHLIPDVFSFFLPEFSPLGKVAEAGLTAPEAQVLNAPKILGLMNGLYSLIEIGMSNCYGGFGDRNTYWCNLYESQSTEYMGSRGYLTYSPTNQDAAGIVDEMALLLTGGQGLSSGAKSVIENAYIESGGGEAGLKMVQRLLVSVPEFHATTVVDSLNSPRPQSTPPQASSIPYKSIVYVNLMGGLDSFNVLVPHSDCQSDMFTQYQSVRGEVALHQSSLHTIDATSSGQVCTTFGIHNSLPVLKSLYDSQELSFLANVGVLSAPATKENWQTTQKTALFSHNTQQEEIQYVDFWDGKDGRGVGGRMADVLSTNGYKPGSVSVAGISTMLRSNDVSQTVSDSSGYQQFNPSSVLSSDITSKVRELNDASSILSNFYAETWSDSLFQTLDENELLYSVLESIDTTAIFPASDLGKQLEATAKLMKTKDTRGTDRDIFYTAITGFDMHAHIAEPLVERLDTINGALDAFVNEMKNDGVWNDVAVVFVSEFGRTLMGNTGNGTDHAWGGNYFIASGSLDGGKILGDYPSDLSNYGPHVFEGVVVPERPWEAVLNGLAEWFGIESSNDLTSVIPNRGAFSNLWSASDLFSD